MGSQIRQPSALPHRLKNDAHGELTDLKWSLSLNPHLILSVVVVYDAARVQHHTSRVLLALLIFYHFFQFLELCLPLIFLALTILPRSVFEILLQ